METITFTPELLAKLKREYKKAISKRMGKSLIIKNMEIKITTGTYNTSDYRVVKEYKSEKAALKFLKTIGYAYDELSNDTWNYLALNTNFQFKDNAYIFKHIYK